MHKRGAPYSVRKRQRIALYVASPPYESLFLWRGRFRLGIVDPLEEGHGPQRLWPNRSTWTPHHALRWGRRSCALTCLHALRLPSCARNPHISSRWLVAQQATQECPTQPHLPSGRVRGITNGIRASRFDTRFETLDFRQVIRVNCLNFKP
ncbi:hypothetical protein M9H77_07541 [Catharanthus roseus]|uniref:Uncharacterized protein n=1 Tax=Catharanthus roseus TaxID=4058 RepID=A0ACC0BV91_CATRO|nr:hypothetical protein M9H77_07541 [Catharanthus roseus]